MDGGRFATLATRNRTVLEAVPSPRGLIFDRSGRALVTNVPTFAVKLRPADLPQAQRPQVVERLAALLGMDAAEINATIDGNPGSNFDLVRIKGDVDENTARLIAEAGFELPGVQVAVEARRQYTYGPLFSQILGYTGPVSADQLAQLKALGYLPDDLVGKTGLEAEYETELRGTYGSQNVERDAAGRRTQVLQTVSDPVPGDSLNLTIDTKEQKYAQTALKWAMTEIGLKRGVVIVMNPQTGEILALVSLPTYDDNLFARGISNADYQALVDDPDRPLLNHATQEHFPPGSTYKLVTGTGGLADKKITASTQLETKSFLTLGTTRFYDWNRRGFGPCDIYCGFGHSSDTFFFQVAGMLGIDRLGYWATQYGFGQKTGIDLPGEVSGIVPTNQWKQDALGDPIFPGETYQAGIGQGYDVVTPIQLINAYAAMANGGTLYQPQIVHDIVGPGRNGRPAVQEEGPPQARRAAKRPEDHAQRRPERRPRAPHLQPGRHADQGRRQVRHGRVRDSRRPGPPAVPLVVRRFRAQGSVQRQLRQPRLAADRPRVRLRLPDQGQRGDRDREVLPADALRDQEGLPTHRSPPAQQLLPEQLMGVIRAEPARVTDWAAKSVGAAWRSFDLQLVTYAGLLVAVGLVMAYTNSVEAGRHEPGRHDVQPRPDVGRHRRGRLRRRDLLRLSLAEDPGLADLRPAARACSS